MDLVDKMAAPGSQLRSPAVQNTDVNPESSQMLACAGTTVQQHREKHTIWYFNIIFHYLMGEMSMSSDADPMR